MNKRLLFILIGVFLFSVIGMIVADYVLLHRPYEDLHIAPNRLILASKSDVENIGDDPSMDQVIKCMGMPQKIASTDGVFGYEWFLNDGTIFQGIVGGNGFYDCESGQSGILPEERQAQWLVFPSIVVVVALVEVAIYFVVRRKHKTA